MERYINVVGPIVGTQDIKPELNQEELRKFTRCVLDDVQALEIMLEQGAFETGVRRIGVEQELFLLDHVFQPAPMALELLRELNDPCFTTELAQFNLEFNLEPLLFSSDCLSKMESRINELMAKVKNVASKLKTQVIQTGILPTLSRKDLHLGNMTPIPRYHALNEAMTRMRGGDYEFQIKGVDDLVIKHESVMLEACNTSFQIHFQVDPSEFPKFYNIAQVVTAPVLAVSTNSPYLFGRQLWRETRIALFQQSVDTRRQIEHLRQAPARVTFGTEWVKESVLEIYREDIARFKVLLGLSGECEDPFAAMEEGMPPKLQALQLHTGTVYRWNRACYGVFEGKPHLRIENRVIPAGPTTLDQVANSAFYFGLMSAMLEEFDDVTQRIEFSQAKGNFISAARNGLNAQFDWLDGRVIPAHKLICEQLLPMAKEGLKHAGIKEGDIERYLGVIQRRVETEQTGSQWFVRSFSNFEGNGSLPQQMACLTSAMLSRQEQGKPVHEWTLAEFEEVGEWKHSYLRVDQYMTTNIFTVNEDEPIELVANLMVWNRLRHVPVEDREHQLVGVVSSHALLKSLASRRQDMTKDPTPIREIMSRKLVSVSPQTDTLTAIRKMRENQVSCLPVVEENKLVGLITETDFLIISRELIIEKLEEK